MAWSRAWAQASNPKYGKGQPGGGQHACGICVLPCRFLLPPPPPPPPASGLTACRWRAHPPSPPFLPNRHSHPPPHPTHTRNLHPPDPRQLQAALADHGSACRGLEGVLADRGAGRPTRAPEADPWASEGRLVLEQQALQTWQDRERAALRKGFQQVGGGGGEMGGRGLGFFQVLTGPPGPETSGVKDGVCCISNRAAPSLPPSLTHSNLPQPF